MVEQRRPIVSNWPKNEDALHFCDGITEKTYCNLDKSSLTTYTWFRKFEAPVARMGFENSLCEGCIKHMMLLELAETDL